MKNSTYQRLWSFINNEMRMSHIYQPVMLIELLKTGKSSSREIAKAILPHDITQVDYYTQIVNNMPGRVLKNHNIVERAQNEYSLLGYNELSSEEIEKLKSDCKKKLKEYQDKRGEEIWRHRSKASRQISGTVKYEVLKRAKTRCELCGISNKIKAIEVDHIIPINKGGSNDISNLQALCYSCNSMKRDIDDINYHKIRESFNHREKGCVFCEVENKNIIDKEELVYAVRDIYPVTPLHTLIIPFRHAKSYFELYQPEHNAINKIINKQKEWIQLKDKNVIGFNIGVNDGEAAGQTVNHCHIHLFPRRKDDVSNPRGGIRAVFFSKKDYLV